MVCSMQVEVARRRRCIQTLGHPFWNWCGHEEHWWVLGWEVEEKNEVLVHDALPFPRQGVGDQYHPCFLLLVFFFVFWLAPKRRSKGAKLYYLITYGLLESKTQGH
jgi:hypothetical protein